MILIAIIIFSVIIFTGYWLKMTGKPYSSIVFTIHKLTALVFAVLITRDVIKGNAAGWELAAAIAGGLAIIALFISGALLSLEKKMPDAFKMLHHIISYFFILVTFFLIFRLGL